MMKNLETVKQRLKALIPSLDSDYRVPLILSEFENNPPIDAVLSVNPAEYYLRQINRVENLADSANSAKLNRKSEPFCIYNMLTGLTTAFYHRQNLALSDTGTDGFRQSGTFLKSIALLPYIKYLGVDTVYLLPVCLRGKTHRKGNAGSPYSVKDPYKIEDSLSEPALGLTPEIEFKAFAEAIHALGMKLVLEFVFRTAAPDSNQAFDHPDRFYWIDENLPDRSSNNPGGFGPPQFDPDILRTIKEKVESEDLFDLPEPKEDYKSLFADGNIKVINESGTPVGIDSSGHRLRIASAFADWPPDDVQPAWTDVTYLKLISDPKHNYTAYNTLRMYDPTLPESAFNRDLFDDISGIIPHYIKEFNIDGIMLDMGHALPVELRRMIVEKAKALKPGFMFWEENFVPSQKSADEGYSLTAGYLPFDLHVNYKVKELLYKFQTEGFPVPCFGTGETHNTPRSAVRAGGIEFSKFAYSFSALTPTVPMIHSGFETGEKYPVNTGLGFTVEDTALYPADTLPLFSFSSFDYSPHETIIGFIKKINEIRARSIDFDENFLPQSVNRLLNDIEGVIAFERIFSGARRLLYIASQSDVSTKIEIKSKFVPGKIKDSLSEKEFVFSESGFSHELKAREILIFEFVPSEQI